MNPRLDDPASHVAPFLEPGEQLLWAAGHSPEWFKWASRAGMIRACIVWNLVTIMLFAIGTAKYGLSQSTIVTAASISFVAGLVGLLLGHFLLKSNIRRQSQSTVYGLTERRVLTISLKDAKSDEQATWKLSHSHDLSSLDLVHVHYISDSVGHIMFKKVTLRSTMVNIKALGFIAIDNPAAVADLLRRHVPPSVAAAKPSRFMRLMLGFSKRPRAMATHQLPSPSPAR